jgi:hypothetical protein
MANANHSPRPESQNGERRGQKTPAGKQAKEPAAGKESATAPMNQEDSAEVFDTGLRCDACGLPLHIPGNQVPVVFSSLKRTGFVFLRCVCHTIRLASAAELGVPM